MTTAKIKAIAPWFGSKRTLAPKVVELLGKHTAYWELFCGSCAVLLAKPPSSQETLIDMHGDLINLARVLKSEDLAVQLYARASRVLCSTDLYREEMAVATPADPLDRALNFLILSWMGRNGTAGTRRTNYAPAMRFTPGGGSTSTRWRNAVESIPDWHERLRNAQFIGGDAFEIIPKIADVRGVAIYADPPYVRGSRASGGGSDYLHDFSEIDLPITGERDQHILLAEQLNRFEKARVVVSYYDCSTVRELYKGWDFVDCTMQKNLHVQNRRGVGQCDAPEILITKN
jgi:DNA adenine methylase